MYPAEDEELAIAQEALFRSSQVNFSPALTFLARNAHFYNFNSIQNP